MMLKFKPLYQQVIFMTGCTSGIGLATLHRAVEQGAKVFMVDRNEEELQIVQDEMRLKGYDTAYTIADVREFDQLQFAVDQCLKTFGGIDTFINNSEDPIMAESSIKEKIEESKNHFDRNFWGVVNGCRTAIPVLKSGGGGIINISHIPRLSSSEQAGLKSASQLAIKGYTEDLRNELKQQGIPIQVSMVTVATQAKRKASSEKKASLVALYTSPVYSEEENAAKAILQCAIKPRKELRLGFVPFKNMFKNGFTRKSGLGILGGITYLFSKKRFS